MRGGGYTSQVHAQMTPAFAPMYASASAWLEAIGSIDEHEEKHTHTHTRMITSLFMRSFQRQMKDERMDAWGFERSGTDERRRWLI